MNFKTINIFDNTIDVYENGSVYKHPKTIIRKNGVKMYVKDIFMKYRIDSRGYYKYDFKVNCMALSQPMHRLLALAFIPNPLNLPCVNHKDGNKLNNNIANLEWCTFKENNNHARDTGLNNSHGEDHYISKLTNDQVFKILKDNRSHRKIAPDYGVCREVIRDIKSGKSWGRITGIKYNNKNKKQ